MSNASVAAPAAGSAGANAAKKIDKNMLVIGVKSTGEKNGHKTFETTVISTNGVMSNKAANNVAAAAQQAANQTTTTSTTSESGKASTLAPVAANAASATAPKVNGSPAATGQANQRGGRRNRKRSTRKRSNRKRSNRSNRKRCNRR